jgi:putative flippase GtrA
MDTTSAIRRWTAFNLVGLAGAGLQLGTVALLVRVMGWHYLPATALAVEAAVLHNFAWHQQWTWRDRPSRSMSHTAARLARFHLMNGAVSLAGNLALTAFLSGVLHIDAVAANLIAIVACSLINFVASEALVFKSTRTAAVLLLVCAPAATAGQASATLAGWQSYEAQLDARYAAAGPAPAGRFFVHDRDNLSPRWREAVMRGEASLVRIDAPGIADGTIHRWIGAVFIPGVTVESALARLESQAGRESEHYTDVLASRVMERQGNRARVFMKLRRSSIITVTYNTEHLVEYNRVSATRATVRSAATRIAELADAGTAQERETPASDDHGFLWRLNAYWRYEAVPGGVIVECESVSLSRTVPFVIRPVASPIVDRIARESLNRTLDGLRAMLTGRTTAKR